MIRFSKKLYKSYPEILSDFKHKRFVSDSDVTPFHFYEKYLPHSKEVWLKFGYFSTNAIRTLSLSFARFIYKGGKATIITNHFYNKQDAEKLFDNTEIDYSIIDNNFNSIEKIKSLLESEKQHFFNCLRYLLEKGKLKIQPVRKIDGSMSHFKEGVFADNSNNYIGFNGSCNFTVGGLMVNGESLDIKTSWGDEIDKKEILDKKSEIDSIINGEDCSYEQLNSSELEIVIKKEGQKKELIELIQDESEINERYKSQKNDIIYKEILIEYEKEKNEPRFPFDEPRQYQIDAYQAWVKNEFQGLFAMATGTGKTITSLNCVLNEYKKNNKYLVFIAVPSIALLNQWINECKEFNFINIITSKDRNYIESLKTNLGTKRNLIFITTYATITNGSFDKLLIEYKSELENFIFIADECHKIGSSKLFNKIPKLFKRRIGLSATPSRKYDEIGSNKLFEFFNSTPPCFTYNYSMKKAILNGVLSEFNYYPKFVSLNDDELKDYIKITKKIAPYISRDGSSKNPEWVNMELINRKRIVNKALNKENLLKNIIQEIKEDENKPDFNFAFIYVPEGYKKESNENMNDNIHDEDLRIINRYKKILGDDLKLKIKSFLGGDSKDTLEHFKNGKVDALLAMKCLDEGVDIPRTQYAIFCSSTGNPGQYIQRRGRVLRTHNDKKIAYIYDMIVIPDIDRYSSQEHEVISAERSIFKSEILRSINFIALAKNLSELLTGKFDEVCKEFDIELASEIKKEQKNYEICK